MIPRYPFPLNLKKRRDDLFVSFVRISHILVERVCQPSRGEQEAVKSAEVKRVGRQLLAHIIREHGLGLEGDRLWLLDWSFKCGLQL